jgi:hypothetical protein
MLLALVAVVIVAPFERVLFTRPGLFTITSVELVLLVALGVYAATLVRHRRNAVPPLPRSVVVASAAVLGSFALAALLTSFEAGNAARFVVRMTLAASLALAAASAIDTEARARLIARVMVSVAAFVALVAVLEAMQWPAVLGALTAFRPGFHVVAGQLRATSTLFYPTIASMYLEIAFAMGLWLLLWPAWRYGRVERALTFVALVIIGAGISATFTRAGLLAMLGSVALLAALRPGDVRVLATLTCSLVAVVFVAHSPELLAARLTTEGSGAWYGATYRVPATLSMTTGGVHQVPVSLMNTGRLAWDSQQDPAFALSYHWIDGTGATATNVVAFEGQRTPFPAVVRPGDTVHLAADVIAPGEPGSYTLVWDVVHETRAWLSTEGVEPAKSLVTVSGNARPIATSRMSQLPVATIRPTRPALWSAALRLAREHPLFGIGPDNYRLASGAYLGHAQWDPRVHANNMYLEVLVGAGAVGLVAFAVLVATTGLALWRRARRASAATHAGAAAALAVWVVIVGHGMVDSFLSFTTTYVTFAIAGGWALSRGLVEGAHDAHRI